MSRLEEIEERVIYGSDSEDAKVDVWVELKDYEYLKEQAERVQELEKTNKNNYWIAADFKFENLKLEEQNKRYREALKWYSENSPHGNIADEALEDDDNIQN